MLAEAESRPFTRRRRAADEASLRSPPPVTVRIPGGLPARRVVSSRVKETPPYPAHLFPLHTVAAFIGSCGSGKSHAAVSLVRDYVDHGCFSRVFVISPTFASNPCFDALSHVIDMGDVYQNHGGEASAVSDVQRKVEEAGARYRAEAKYAAAYQRFAEHKEEPGDEALLEKENFRPPVDQDMPSMCLVIDDCSHSPIFTTSQDNPFANIVLRHRHVGGIGLSIVFCVQTYRTGVPKALRQGAIRQLCVFPTKDHTQTDALWEEVGNLVTKEKFYELYKRATKGSEHNFLLIDVNPPGTTFAERLMFRFRKNFDELLVVKDDDEDSESDAEVKSSSDSSDAESDGDDDGSVLWAVARPERDIEASYGSRGVAAGGASRPAPAAAAAGGASLRSGPVWSNGFSGWQAAYREQDRAASEAERTLLRRARAAVARRGREAITAATAVPRRVGSAAGRRRR
jgi:hypothetical protein